MRIGVVGCGNVGFSMLIVSAEQGQTVLGFDPSPKAQERVCNELGTNALAISLSELNSCEIVFVCVPTDPAPETGECDLSCLAQVVRDLDQSLSPGTVIAIRSTCPPGTAREISKTLRAPIAVNPSFLTKKTKISDTRWPPRIAYAGPQLANAALDRFYSWAPAEQVFRSTEWETVEYLKYVENCIDAVLVSLWNEFLALGEAVGLSSEDTCQLMNRLGDRPRFSSAVRVPGGAFGKWCLPKDLKALIFEARSKGTPHNVLEAADRTNDWVRANWGENPHAFHDLINQAGGRLTLGNIAIDWLADAHDAASASPNSNQTRKTPSPTTSGAQ